eukprot:GHVS01059858.1.p1 GENE.GHVS01059858.1~~GHVS01059858.1.p1  ORF type:complete len:865 (-),score=272.52 GHVS01059858.1:2137-4731(-)
MLSHLQNIPLQLLDSIPASTSVEAVTPPPPPTSPSSPPQCLSLHSALQSSAAVIKCQADAEGSSNTATTSTTSGSSSSNGGSSGIVVDHQHLHHHCPVVLPVSMRNTAATQQQHRRQPRGLAVSARRGGRSKKRITKHDAAYRQMEALGSFVEERSRTDVCKLDTSSVPYEVLSDPSRYQHERWKEGFSIKLGADGRRLLLRKLRAIYGGSPDKWSPLFHEMGINAKNVFTMATVPCLFKIAYIMGAGAWDFALKCACFTIKCSALKNRDCADATGNDDGHGGGVEGFGEEEEDEEDVLAADEDRGEVDAVQRQGGSSSPSEESRPPLAVVKRAAKSTAAAAAQIKRKRLKSGHKSGGGGVVAAVLPDELAHVRRGVKTSSTAGGSSEGEDNNNYCHPQLQQLQQPYANGFRAATHEQRVAKSNRRARHFSGSTTAYCHGMYSYGGNNTMVAAQPVFYYGNDGHLYQTYSDESSPMSPYVPDQQHVASGGGHEQQQQQQQQHQQHQQQQQCGVDEQKQRLMSPETVVKWEEENGEAAADQYYYDQLATSLPAMGNGGGGGGGGESGGYPYILGSYSYDLAGMEAVADERADEPPPPPPPQVMMGGGGKDEDHHSISRGDDNNMVAVVDEQPSSRHQNLKDCQQAREVFEAFRSELATSRHQTRSSAIAQEIDAAAAAAGGGGGGEVAKSNSMPTSSAVPLNFILSQSSPPPPPLLSRSSDQQQQQDLCVVPASVLAALQCVAPPVDEHTAAEDGTTTTSDDGHTTAVGCQTTMSCLSSDVCLVPVSVLLQGWSQHVDIRNLAQQSAQMYERSWRQHAALKHRLISGGWLPQAGVDALDAAYDIPCSPPTLDHNHLLALGRPQQD